MWEAQALNRRRRVRPRRRLTPRFFGILAALVLLCYMCYGYVDGFVKITQLRRAIQEVRREVAVLQARNEQLRAELQRLNSDAYIERVARERLGLVMPGETSYVVITEEDR